MTNNEYGYLCTRRPADLGTIPSGATHIERMDGNTIVHPDYRIFPYKPWDIVYYDHELSIKDVERYELTPKFDFTGGLLTEFFQIREEIKQGQIAVDFDSVIEYNDVDRQFSEFGLLLLKTIRYDPLDEVDWCALYTMLCIEQKHIIDKSYGVYFDKYELRVDENGHLMNPEAIRIIEFDYDEQTDKIVASRRVDENGCVIEENPDLSDYINVGYDDECTIRDALQLFWKWLEENTEWRQLYRETYWQPAEYICIGISGCV